MSSTVSRCAVCDPVSVSDRALYMETNWCPSVIPFGVILSRAKNVLTDLHG